MNNVSKGISILAGNLIFVLLFSGCSSIGQRGPGFSLAEPTRPNISEREVLSLMGNPDRIIRTEYYGDAAVPVKYLYYDLADGSKWFAVMNEKDCLLRTGIALSVALR